MAVTMRAASVFLMAALVLGSAVAESSVQMLETEDSGVVDCGIRKAGCKENFYRDSKTCICRICPKCELGKSWRKEKCGGAKSGQCAQCSTCQDDTHEVGGCNLTRDTKCDPCTQCADGQTEERPCESNSNRVCKACKKCQAEEYVAQDCTRTKDTTCAACKTCTAGKQFETKPCGSASDPHSDRQCQDCRVCSDGTYETAKCNAKEDTTCKQCTTCKDGEYESTKCTSEQDRVCSPYQYVVLGKTVNPEASDLQQKTKDDMAYVRCVDNTKGISVCDDGCHKTKTETGDLPECSKSFVPMENGKKCYGACKPDDGVAQRTLESAKAFCEALGMWVPKTNADLARAKGTGCNYNKQPIWFDKQTPTHKSVN